MQIDLSGKKALVCGASKGIGRATAIMLAQAGADVTVLARDAVELENLCADIKAKTSKKARSLVLDLSETNRIAEKVSSHIRLHGVHHILVNNSGGPAAGPVHSAKSEEFIQAFSQHLLANHVLSQALLEGMKEAGYGRIINIISTSVKQPIPNLGVSNTIRGAVANWAKTLASELGPFGITVNNILPGATETERLTQLFQNKAAKNNMALEEVVIQEKSLIPTGRFAQPEEIAVAIAFLASPLASYINGINLPVDGGRTGSL